jgi:hypothetical protein
MKPIAATISLVPKGSACATLAAFSTVVQYTMYILFSSIPVHW